MQDVLHVVTKRHDAQIIAMRESSVDKCCFLF